MKKIFVFLLILFFMMSCANPYAETHQKKNLNQPTFQGGSPGGVDPPPPPPPGS